MLTTDKPNRRKILAMTAAGAAGGLAGCLGGDNNGPNDGFRPIEASEIPPDGTEGSVNSWHIFNGWMEAITDSFEDEYGLSVNHAFHASPQPVRAELNQGNSEIDVSFGLPNILQEGLQDDNNWFEPLPTEIMDGWESNLEEVKELDEEHFTNDDGDVVAISYSSDWAPALVYNTDYFDEPPDSWDIFWEEDLAGDIALSQLHTYPCRIAALYTGQDPTDPDDFEEIEEVLVQQRDLNQTYWGDFSMAQEMMSREDIVATVNTPGRASLSRFQDDAPVDWTIPQEGSVLDYGQMFIPTGAPNPRGALAFLDWALRPENQVRLFTEHATAPTISAFDDYAEELDLSQEQIDFIDDSDRVPDDIPDYNNIEESAEVNAEYADLWTRVMGA
ncbi:PotD/PotF family extracellular solute-binding protein [Halosolutus amylolyticus]|uniref:PotD/PotF family extracellular solute-binding protein n=1 Tax=Halosolutus amylolyticus TaxID=2932267 RepID=A0ABD5PIU6_9EURY|nr:PotD/PotF family extracellular solute-binding protein [Halosolutus amylolyticus]